MDTAIILDCPNNLISDRFLRFPPKIGGVDKSLPSFCAGVTMNSGNMNKSRLISFIIIAAIFALIGIYLASIIDLPDPFTLNSTRLVYAVLGILLSVLFFSKITALVVKTTARLASAAVKKLAEEIIKQFTTHNPFSPQPYTEQKHELAGVLIIDTSSLIDGRVLEVARSGFLSGLVLIPDFVLKELQLVADSADSLKRSRGRRGFEIITQLKKVKGLKVEVWDRHKITGSKEASEVDDRLIALAKTLGGKLITCDFNLNQVAKLRGVIVLNINDLTNALKSLPVPGETLKVKLIHPGKDKDQMVGYLDDGTMIVVKDALEQLDKEIEVTVSKVIQGSAGRMVFAKMLK